jgi:hypothetical protein
MGVWQRMAYGVWQRLAYGVWQRVAYGVWQRVAYGVWQRVVYGVWQGVAMWLSKVLLVSAIPSPSTPYGQKRLIGHYRGDPPTGRVACS